MIVVETSQNTLICAFVLVSQQQPYWHYQLVLSWYHNQPESHQLNFKNVCHKCTNVFIFFIDFMKPEDCHVKKEFQQDEET